MSLKDNNRSNATGGGYTGSELLSVAPYPFRRFFARILDYFVYEVLLMGISCLLPYRLAMDVSVFAPLVAPLLMIFIEPLLLNRFGTTVGKAVLGLHLESIEGRKLTYFEGLVRVWRLFLYGMGLVFIPIFNIVRLGISFTRCYNKEVLLWDIGICYTAKRKWWQILLYIATFLLGIFLLLIFFTI